MYVRTDFIVQNDIFVRLSSYHYSSRFVPKNLSPNVPSAFVKLSVFQGEEIEEWFGWRFRPTRGGCARLQVDSNAT
jgi:hypothetical protein